jgi:threonine/homoserine/homoserine lactone efflux protein
MITSAFIISSAVILLTSGPTNTLLAASGAVMGFRASLALPAAEALGYALAISFFAMLTAASGAVSWLLPLLKAIAAVWLLVSAVKLWSASVDMEARPFGVAFGRILVTTILNPKAMLVGTMLIPLSSPGEPALWIGTFVALSILAGIGWVAFGSLLPNGVRRHAYKGAAIVLSGFSVVAATSVIA